MNDLYLCSFASPDLERSVKRFLDQSKSMKIYKDIKVFKYDDLNTNKKKQIKNFFKQGKTRLYGYACWKPEIILQYLKKIPKNSILQYSDIGNHFNKKGIKRLRYYVNLADKYNALVFQYKFSKLIGLKFQRYFEYQYTKSDAWKYLKITNNSSILKTEQILSGLFFIKNNSFSIKILNKWKNACDKSHLIDDSKSIYPNHKNFIEHRHDQSLFSLICKKKNLYSLSASECEWAINKQGERTWKHLENYPIHAKRDKKFNFFKHFIFRQKKNLMRRFKNEKIRNLLRY